MSAKGSVVIDELVIPITDIYLDHGKFWIVAEVTGPIRAVDTRDYIVNGRDGATVVHAKGISGLEWDQLPAGAHLIVITPLSFTDRRAQGVDK